MALLVALLVSGAAQAQPAGDRPAAAEARQAFTRGVALMERAQWMEALAEFERSIELRPTQVALFNAAMCQKNLGRFDAAVATLGRLLDDFDDATERRRGEYRAELEAIRARMAQIAITTHPEGAQVLVDGRSLGVSPIPDPVFLLPGDHEIEARKEGLPPAREEVTLREGEVRSVRLRLEAEPPPPPPPRPRDSGASPTWFWLSAGVAGAATIATAVLGTLAVTGDTAYEADENRTAADQDDGKRLVLFTDLSLGVAVLSAGAAAILWSRTDFGGADRDAGVPKLRVALGQDRIDVVLGGSL